MLAERFVLVTGKNFTTKKALHETLRDQVIPNYKRFLEGLRGIYPEQDEMKRLHGIYVRGAGLIYDGFKIKMLGLEKKDGSLLMLSNDKIRQGLVETETWRKELLALCVKYGVSMEGNEKKKEN